MTRTRVNIAPAHIWSQMFASVSRPWCVIMTGKWHTDVLTFTVCCVVGSLTSLTLSKLNVYIHRSV